MTPNEYQELAVRTAAEDESPFVQRFAFPMPHLIHAHLGITSESGELSDTLKKHLIYGQPLDVDNINEELGDLLWYVSLAATCIGSKLEDIMQANVDKLKIRYPEKFTEKDARERKDKA